MSEIRKKQYNKDMLACGMKLMKCTETVCVERMSKATYVKGRPSLEECEKFDILANIQPVTGRELLMVPEGERSRNHLDVFTETRLKPKDVVVRFGERFEVHFVEEWGPYFKARVRGTDVDPV